MNEINLKTVEEDIKHQYNWGNLLEAENLAMKCPDLEISKTVIERMVDIREWNRSGKPHGYCDPDSWEQMPKFQKACDTIKSHFKGQGARILDVGCFTGYFSRKMNEFGHDAYGCDIQNKLMNILNFRFCGGRQKFHPVKAENIGIYFEKEIFDVVTFLDSLEHVLDDKAAVKGAIDIIKPGGLIIIHVPQGEKYADDSHEHLRIYTQKSLNKLLPGIKIEEMKDEHGQPTFFGVWEKGMVQT